MARKPKISNSRPARWARAVEAAQKAKEAVDAALEELNAAREELAEIKQEYEDWKDNLPDNMQSGALYDKLETVSSFDLDTEPTIENADWIDEAEGMDLPLGFGRD